MQKKYKIILDIFLFVLLVVVVAAFALWFVSLEHYFYFWDFGGYQQTTYYAVGDVVSFASLRHFLKLVLNSFREDYNLLFTVPLVPTLRVIGDYHARSSYILGLALIYFTPYVVTIGLLAKKLLPQCPRAAFWFAVAITLLLPVSWLPTLRGYPDTGPAFLIAFSIWLYLQNPELKKWWQILLIGFCMALAALLRRHFAYGITAFLVAAAIDMLFRTIIQARGNRRRAFLGLMKGGLRLGAVVVVAVVTLWLIARPFLLLVLTRNYTELYSSWQVSPLKVFYGIKIYYGWILIALGCLGLVLGSFSRLADRRGVIFIALLGSVSAIQWFFVVRQPNPHYTLHFTFAILLGLVILLGWIWTRPNLIVKIAGILLLSMYFALNSVFWLKPDAIPVTPPVRTLFTAWTEPLQRPDYDTLVRLMNTLHATVPSGAPVYLVDSSAIMATDLVRSADFALYVNRPLNLMWSPQVDSRDYYPLETLLKADYLILSTPLQIHLSPSEQQVVSTIYDAFDQNWDVAKDFVRLPDSFALMGGVQTSIYQRVRPTPIDAAIRALYQIQQNVGRRPGSQLDWIQLDDFSYTSFGGSDGRYHFSVQFPGGGSGRSVTFLYLGNLPTSALVNGTLQFQNPECLGVEVTAALAYSDGMNVPVQQQAYSREAPTLSWMIDTLGAPYLLMTFSQPADSLSPDPCQILVDGMTVEGK